MKNNTIIYVASQFFSSIYFVKKDKIWSNILDIKLNSMLPYFEFPDDPIGPKINYLVSMC